MQKITPFLWYDRQAGEAASFYVSIFNKSKITGIEGQDSIALNGGPQFKFTPAESRQ